MIRLVAACVICALLCGCASLRYYGQAAWGEASVLASRRSIDRVLHDPGTSPERARRLLLARQARAFASAQLDLPDNRSYTTYVALDRPFVAWNVFAAPRYSVEAIAQCFPIAGCVAYRGYFSHARAQADAARLAAAGDDVWVGGVPAFSTLGWFADPILSSMLRWDDDELAGTIFHELAHQNFYLKGDTAFNESYATFVQRQGLREWRRQRELAPPDEREAALDRRFAQLVLGLRRDLAQAYAHADSAGAKEQAKRAQIAAFRDRFDRWRRSEGKGAAAYSAWVAAPINNARLLPFGLYDQWTPAFATLFRRAGDQWPSFYASVRALAALPPAARHARLKALLGDRQYGDRAPIDPATPR